jgi:glycosyltransferase involved in cell wall biosynthesis
MDESRPLKILHVLRAPLGGLFRHVADLMRAQIERGHHVGMIADSTRLGAQPEGIIETLRPKLALGVARLPIGRHLNVSDISAALHIRRLVSSSGADVVHGHGAKGGAFARLCAPADRVVRAYTPHGGSLLYRPGTPASAFYITLEKLLRPFSDLLLFESAYAAKLYRAKVGPSRAVERVVSNGVGPAEFAPVQPNPDASDILFVGELRPIKGVDMLLNAVAEMRRNGLPITASIVGSGPARAELEAQSRRLGLAAAVIFHGPLPARDAFKLGRLMVIPSRAESMPYIVLETAAAGIPMITTAVGGIPDIFGAEASRLLRPDDQPALVAAMTQAVNDPATIRASAEAIRARVRSHFSIERMVDGVLAGYREALRRKSSVSG